MGEDDRDRPKRSWREIDQLRDGGGSGRRPRKSANQQTLKGQAAKRYRNQLDRVFSGGVLPTALRDQVPSLGAIAPTPQQELETAVRAAVSPTEIAGAVDAFLATLPMPQDSELLLKILAHPRASHAKAALESMLEVLDRGKPSRAELIKARILAVKTESDDPEIISLANCALAML